ncbi:MAG: hypothetical protein H7Z72_04690 [Bacteroidetes bacterium]|nr:hypothetical protein [Fibrella sp.]
MSDDEIITQTDCAILADATLVLVGGPSWGKMLTTGFIRVKDIGKALAQIEHFGKCKTLPVSLKPKPQNNERIQSRDLDLLLKVNSRL